LREATTGEELDEPGIAPVRIPFDVDGQVHEMHVTLGVGFVEPGKRGVAIVEAGIHERHCIGRHVSLE